MSTSPLTATAALFGFITDRAIFKEDSFAGTSGTTYTRLTKPPPEALDSVEYEPWENVENDSPVRGPREPGPTVWSFPQKWRLIVGERVPNSWSRYISAVAFRSSVSGARRLVEDAGFYLNRCVITFGPNDAIALDKEFGDVTAAQMLSATNIDPHIKDSKAEILSEAGFGFWGAPALFRPWIGRVLIYEANDLKANYERDSDGHFALTEQDANRLAEHYISLLKASQKMWRTCSIVQFGTLLLCSGFHRADIAIVRSAITTRDNEVRIPTLASEWLDHTEANALMLEMLKRMHNVAFRKQTLTHYVDNFRAHVEGAYEQFLRDREALLQVRVKGSIVATYFKELPTHNWFAQEKFEGVKFLAGYSMASGPLWERRDHSILSRLSQLGDELVDREKLYVDYFHDLREARAERADAKIASRVLLLTYVLLFVAIITVYVTMLTDSRKETIIKRLHIERLFGGEDHSFQQ